jgi:drug/metabolite transporter (DMT)-like permease
MNIANVVKGIRRALSKVPLLSNLVSFGLRDHRLALTEFLLILLFSFLPLLVGCFVAFLQKFELNWFHWALSNVQNGELLLYSCSLLAPVFYVVMRYLPPIRAFPSKMSYMLVYIGALLAAAIVFALGRAEFRFDYVALEYTSWIVFLCSLFLLYCTLVYSKSLEQDATAVIRQEEATFTEAVTKRRGKASHD